MNKNPFEDQPPEEDLIPETNNLIQVDLEPDFHIPAKKIKAPIEIGKAAHLGFIGDWTRATAPQSESNFDNLLLQFTITSGVLFGRHFYTTIDRELFPNLFGVVLGPSGAGRKSGGLIAAKKFFETAAPDWRGARSNWKSGEAVIHFTRDATFKANGTEKDPGVIDKRVLIEETELIHLFRMGQRDGNTLTSILRDAWDSPAVLYNTSKGSAASATGAHVGLLGHMTREEFLLVDPGLVSNGMINRITWGNGYQAQKIDDPQPLQWPQALFDQFREIYLYATGSADFIVGAPERAPVYMPLNPEAKALWRTVYHNLPVYPGTLAVVLERYLAQARKFALIYAIFDQSPVIQADHLAAGLAIVDYSKANALEIFQNFGPNPFANKLLHALHRNPEGIHKAVVFKKVFNNKLSADEIHEAVINLLENDLIYFEGKIIHAKTP